MGAKVGEAITKVPGVVDVLNGIDNTISGPAIVYRVNPLPLHALDSRRKK